MWDNIEFLEAFNIKAIPRMENSWADSLAVSALLLLPHLEFDKKKYHIEIIYRLNVLDNVNHWQVFDDDKKIEQFLSSVGCFVNSYFEGSSGPQDVDHLGSLKDREVIQLKGNKIPHRLVSLENMFSRRNEV